MDGFDRNRRLIEDFTDRTLAAISTDYGRLLYLSTLRDLGTGAYSHSGLETLYPAGAVQEALAASHRSIFDRILQTSLERQLYDLRNCFDAYTEDAAELATRWSDVEFYRSLMPLGLPGALKELFCTNLAALLAAIELEATAAQAA
ncbi:MAG TPA: hypothetical protein VFO34_08740 [Candidatus Acidoferrales bacterium]|nr:hypothetical protein [Candidatus Acidoferrales bacterium]